ASLAIAQHAAATPAFGRARRVAVYLSMSSEPGTGPLIEELFTRGIEVVAPISLPDHTLDWSLVEPGAPTTTAPIGMDEPIGPRLGPGTPSTCDLIVLPALAVAHDGHRLGRGAGFYDRALAGVDVPRCALVFAHEVLPDVPHEDHDLPMQMALTPQGLFRVL
ncbi:MAG: 5-formyltetrahydrofolate cyclo-ligase, partial [Aeromicrobium sp.]